MLLTISWFALAVHRDSHHYLQARLETRQRSAEAGRVCWEFRAVARRSSLVRLYPAADNLLDPDHRQTPC